MRKLIILLFLAIPCSLSAQQAFTEFETDRVTYEQFQQGQFKALKATLKNATENGIDFYYLRLRAGILAYNNKQYEYAVTQFTKALEFFPADTISKEYLYYAYLFTSRTEMAGDFASKQDIYFQNKVNYKKQPFDIIGIGFGSIITNQVKQNQQKNFIKAGISAGKSERILNGNLYYGEIFFQNTIKNRLHINNSFSLFNTNSTNETAFKTPADIFTFNKQYSNLNFQYNIGLSYITKKQWAISIGFGYYNLKNNVLSIRPSQPPGNQFFISDSTQKINSFLGSFILSKRFSYVQPYLQVSASNLNSITQLQTETGLTYYPLGNYTFYGTTSAAFLKNGTAKQFVIRQLLGVKFTKWWWSELNFMYGNLSNYNTNNGFLTYNTLDPVKINAGINFNFYIQKHVQLHLGYDLQQRESLINQEVQNSVPPAPPVTSIQTSNYLSHLIKTGILWKF